MFVYQGGNFLYKDILTRSQATIRKSAEARELGDIEFVGNKHQLQSGWVGGSIVSTLPIFNSYWLTNREWK
jgi:actin-related protein